MRKIGFVLLLVLLVSVAPMGAVADNPYVEYNVGSNRCIVYPTGGDDTANIQEAFDLVSGGKAGWVELVAGEYAVSEEIVAVNFDGTFTGEGPETVLQTSDRSDWPHRDVEPFPEVASVFLFYQTDMDSRRIRIMDMTVEVHATTYDYDGFFGLNVFDIYGCVDGADGTDATPLDTMLKRVTVTGDVNEAWPFTNVVNTFQVGGEPHVGEGGWSFESLSGTHFAVDCVFNTVGASVKYNSVDGKVYVCHNEINDNLVGIWLYICDTVGAPHREISHNTISGSGWIGLAVWASNGWKIHHNTITDGDIGLDMWGSDGNCVKNNLVSGNNMDLSWDQAGDNTWKNNTYDTQNWP